MNLLVVLVAFAAQRVSTLTDLSDIPGKFCEGRSVQCCASRQDSCSVPIMGTMCYCDQFCVRDYNDDCCPDYPYVCMNQTRPTPPQPSIQPTCWYKGSYHPQGTVLKINCNECKCERMCQGSGCQMEFKCSTNRCLVDPQALTQVNQDSGNGWTATNYTQFWGHTLEEGLAKRLGTRHSKRRAYTMRPINTMFDRERVRSRLWYDLRTDKPYIISPPLDQGWCGADWVISTVQVATDRLALVSKGEDHALLSPQHLLSCNSKNQRGCDGGHLTRAWKFIQKFGLVPEECYPWVGGHQTNCSISKVQDRRKISARCVNGNSFMPLHRTGPAYRVSSEPEAIMNEIMTSGPVQATMRVPQDFFNYRSGVYRCGGSVRSRKSDNYHSVRIVGWGEEVQQRTLIKYWIVSNSWGTWWGEGGYFRILRGVNECEIESLVLASWINPIVPKRDPSMSMDNTISNTLS